MCVIIDRDIAVRVFDGSGNFRFVHDWLFGGTGHMVTGGKNTQELAQTERIQLVLETLEQAGRLTKYSSARIDAIAEQLASACKSNDSHVIALAQVSGARTLVSLDKALCDDFQNLELVNGPRGTIYKNSTHRSRLKHTDGCPGRSSNPKPKVRP